MSIHSLIFNQDASLLTCGINTGLIIYKLDPSIEKNIFIEQKGGVGICSILDRTNILTIVGGGDTPCIPKNMINIYDIEKKSTALEINFSQSIRNTILTRDNNHFMIIVLEKKIFTCDDDGINYGYKDTYCNEKGLCKISDKNSLTLVTLGEKKGEVAIWELKKDTYKTIEAHSNNIEAITINKDGTLIATASEMGTNIHVYQTSSSKLVYKFKRGTFASKIYDISFNWNSTILACTSQSGTVHLFQLYKEEDKSQNSRSILSSMSRYLPDYLGKDYFGSQWGFIQIDLETNSRTVCAFDEKNVLNIASYDGYFFKIWGTDFRKIEKNRLHINNV